MPLDIKALGAELADIVAAQVTPLLDRIKSLESQLAALPEPVPGKDGKDVDMEQVRQMVADAVAALPAPQDGKSFTLEDAQPVIERAVGLIVEEAEKNIAIEVKKAVAAIPVPKDGQDGKSLVHFFVNRDGELIGTRSDGAIENFGVIVGQDGKDGADGKDGKDGIDGKDGLSFESFAMEYDPDNKEIVHKAIVAGCAHEIRFPVSLGIQARGYWRDGLKAEAGDAYTHEGSLWIAKRSTMDTPSTKSEVWMLAARKGRDGERGPKGKDGAPPAPIKLGEDE